MINPFFSIVIPCYNSERTIDRALLSVLHQTEVDYEIVLVDDGSTDNTLKVVQDFLVNCSCLSTILTGYNQGASVARNKGALAANGIFLAFLDSDDEWHPEKLAIQRKCIEDGNLNFIASGYTLDPFPTILLKPTVHLYTLQDLLWKNRFSTPGVVIKKDFFWSVGGFEKHQRYAEDYTLWMKLAVTKPLVALLAPQLVRLYKPAFGTEGLSANSWKMTLGEISGYYYLYQNKNITFFRFILAFMLSLVKYTRRKVILLLRKTKNAS